MPHHGDRPALLAQIALRGRVAAGARALELVGDALAIAEPAFHAVVASTWAFGIARARGAWDARMSAALDRLEAAAPQLRDRRRFIALVYAPQAPGSVALRARRADLSRGDFALALARRVRDIATLDGDGPATERTALAAIDVLASLELNLIPAPSLAPFSIAHVSERGGLGLPRARRAYVADAAAAARH